MYRGELIEVTGHQRVEVGLAFAADMRVVIQNQDIVPPNTARAFKVAELRDHPELEIADAFGDRVSGRERWVGKFEVEIGGLRPGRHSIRLAERNGALGANPRTFDVWPGHVAEVHLERRPIGKLQVGVESGLRGVVGALRVRDLESGDWLPDPPHEVAGTVHELILRLPFGNYAVNVRYPTRTLERAAVLDQPEVAIELK